MTCDDCLTWEDLLMRVVTTSTITITVRRRLERPTRGRILGGPHHTTPHHKHHHHHHHTTSHHTNSERRWIAAPADESGV